VGPSDTALATAQVAFARCMRGHGIDYPDPQRVEGGGSAFVNPDLDGVAPEALDAAFERCGSHLESSDRRPPAKERLEWLDALLAYARCMRSEGITNLPDPRAGELTPGAIPIRPEHKGDPLFERATRRCDRVVAETEERLIGSGAGAP
jgi:hypothetical protein